MSRRIRAKLHSEKGMSLLEVLSAVLILLMVSGGLTTTVKLATDHYNKSMRVSESKVLCSTLVAVISNELAYTTDIRVDGSGNVMAFLSETYGMHSNLSTFMTDADDEEDYGKIMLGDRNDSSNKMNLIGRSAYTGGLTAKVDSVTYENEKSCFFVVLKIGYQGEEYLKEEFQVLNVNQTRASLY